MSKGIPRVGYYSPGSIFATPREAEILHLLRAEGLTNREIAQRLGITIKTVQVHLYRLGKKMKQSNRTKLAVAESRKQGDEHIH